MIEIIDRLQAKAREQKYRLTFHAEKEREADRILRHTAATAASGIRRHSDRAESWRRHGADPSGG